MKTLFALLLVAAPMSVAAEEAGAAGKDRAPAANASGAGEASVAPKASEKKICKRDYSSVTRMGAGPKRCLTAAEWRRRRD